MIVFPFWGNPVCEGRSLLRVAVGNGELRAPWRHNFWACPIAQVVVDDVALMI